MICNCVFILINHINCIFIIYNYKIYFFYKLILYYEFIIRCLKITGIKNIKISGGNNISNMYTQYNSDNK